MPLPVPALLRAVAGAFVLAGLGRPQPPRRPEPPAEPLPPLRLDLLDEPPARPVRGAAAPPVLRPARAR